MTKYSCKFNKATIEKLNNIFTPEGVTYLQEEVTKNWDDFLNGEGGIKFQVLIDTPNLFGKCQHSTVESLLKNLSCVNFEFEPKTDMEEIKSTKAPIGVWIKSHEISKYDFSYLDGSDVLIRNHDVHYWGEEDYLNVTSSYTSYKIGFIHDGNVFFSSSKYDSIPLEASDYDIMVIKLDTDK